MHSVCFSILKEGTLEDAVHITILTTGSPVHSVFSILKRGPSVPSVYFSTWKKGPHVYPRHSLGATWQREDRVREVGHESTRHGSADFKVKILIFQYSSIVI